MQQKHSIHLVVVVCSIATTTLSAFVEKPNVVIVITDDQGYGDVAVTGNPAIKTPTIDKFSDWTTKISKLSRTFATKNG